MHFVCLASAFLKRALLWPSFRLEISETLIYVPLPRYYQLKERNSNQMAVLMSNTIYHFHNKINGA